MLFCHLWCIQGPSWIKQVVFAVSRCFCAVGVCSCSAVSRQTRRHSRHQSKWPLKFSSVWVQFLNWTPAFITSADICCFFFFLLLIIKYSETDAVKHNRQQRFKAGTVSKDVFLFYCVQEHVESEPLKSWQIIYLLNSCMELSWSILWRHNMCTRSLMCTWIWIKIFICAPFIILIQIRQTEFISLCCIMWIKMMHTRDYHDPDQDHIFCFKVIF